jgi:Protein of unknown function (DUF551)
MEWISVKDKFPGKHCIVDVKTSTGIESKCYYHADGMSWLFFYTKEADMYFQDMKTLNFLHNVTHWKHPEKIKMCEDEPM